MVSPRLFSVQRLYILANKHLSRNFMGKKNIIHTPEPEKPIWEIIIDLVLGKEESKNLLDWVKDNSFN